MVCVGTKTRWNIWILEQEFHQLLLQEELGRCVQARYCNLSENWKSANGMGGLAACTHVQGVKVKTGFVGGLQDGAGANNGESFD